MDNSNSKKEDILIIDKSGAIGGKVSEKLLEEAEKVTLISFFKKLPKIPNSSYSKIIIIYNGEKEVLQVIPDFIKEAKKINAKLIIVLSINFFNNSLIEKFERLGDPCIIFLGELFGAEEKDFNQTRIDNLLNTAKLEGKIDVSNMGMQKLYPVLLTDAVSKIAETVTKKRLIPRNFYLFPRHALTELSFARILKKIEPSINITFSKIKESKIKQDRLFLKGEYAFEESYPLEQKIKQVFNAIPMDKDKRQSMEKKKIDFKKESNSSKKSSFLFFCLLLLVLFLPIIATFTFSLFGVLGLKITKEEIVRGNFTSAKNIANISNIAFGFSKDLGKVFVFESSLIGQENNALGVVNDISVGKEVSQSLVNLFSSFDNFVKSTSTKTKTPREDFILASNLLKKSIISFQTLKTEKNTFLPKDFLGKDGESLINLVSGVIDAFPEVFGFNNERKYLVLFQNNMELRPGGGFIGSYGLLSLKNAAIKDFSLFDVYDADGQLKGHVEPPFAVRRYLPQVHWYLRDSNFDVDFSKNASNAAFFLDLETSEQVNGVIAVDLSFVKNLLKVLGPLEVPDYNETVTSDNLYLLTQKHAEKNFFPGSTQKKDFLRSLFNSARQNILTKNDLSYLSLLKIIGEAIQEKHLLMAFGDPAIQPLFTVNGFSSSLWDGRQSANDTVNDFLGISEANLGVNKANYFVKRKITQDVLIDSDGSISENVTVLYKNNSTGWPGGDYKNYLRFVLPLGTRIQSVWIDDKEQELVSAVTDFNIYEDKNFKPPTGLEIEESKDNGKTIFGFLIIIPSNVLKKVSVSYLLPNNNLLDLPSFSYSNRVFKQPGTENDQYSFSLSYPKDLLKVFNLSKDVKGSEDKISCSTDLSSDLDFEITFSQK
ncbi:MAG: DUF4012 domain-containing protein [Candidatus Levyibacteriota bacterium]